MAIEDVSRAKADLLAAGENLDGKCGAHKIAAQTAWDMRHTGQGWGLVHSTGSGCEINSDIYRCDSLMLKDGTTKDILLYAESRDGLVYPDVGHDEYNIPAWNETGPQDPANWREPYDPGLVEEGGGEGGEGTDDGAAMDTQAILDAIAASQDAVAAHVTAEADRTIDAVLADLKRLEEEVETFANQALKILILLRQRQPEP
jgi:hypothetical protein